MTNIFVIANEHQIVQVEYVIDNLTAEEENLLLCENSLKDTSIIRDFINRKNIKTIYFKSWKIQDILKFKRIDKYFVDLVREVRKKRNDFRIFSSQYGCDYVLLLSANLLTDKFYLLDEGTASIKVAYLRRKRVRIDKIFKIGIKSAIYRTILKYPKVVTFITDYDLKIHERDSVKKIKHDIQRNHVDRMVDEVHVIGSSMVEMKIVKEVNYINYIKSILSGVQGKEMFYFSHKKEKNSKLKKIDGLGINIVPYDSPYEFRFSNTTEIPFRIYSFISPVVYNIANRFENIPELYTVSFPVEHILTNKIIYQEILDTYSRHLRIKTLKTN